MWGRLTLAGIDLRTPVANWLDSVYAIVADAPHDVLESMFRQVTKQGARARPDRDTWGALPEHQAISINPEGGARG